LDTHQHFHKLYSAAVNGSNGEICKGQWWEVLAPYIGRRGHFDARRIAAARFAFGAPPPALLNFEFSEDLVEDFAGIIRRATAGMDDYPNTALLDCVYLTLRMQRWQGRLASATARIWPVISPYAFREPMEAALAAPVRLRVRHRLSRRVIEYQSPRLAAIPLAQGYPALPLRWNTAHHFWPLVVEMAHNGLRAAKRAAGLIERKHTYSRYPLKSIAHLREVRELLDPAQMLTRDLYRSDLLTAVVQNGLTGTSPEFAGRILTLEMTARAIHNAASGLHSHAGAQPAGLS
jgi:hypothetical protein